MIKPFAWAWVVLVAITTLQPQQALFAADEFKDLKTVRTLPKTTGEMDRLHRNCSANQCDAIPEGQSLETTNYALIQFGRPSLEKAKPAIRFSILSVGLTMDSSDRADLPMASRSKILEYIETHYVSVQVRMLRDLVSGKQYFHDRPLAATVNFRGSKVTQPFDPVVNGAMRDFRSVGLFTKKPSGDRTPEDLRTLVLIFRNVVVKSNSRTGSQLEYGFVRGRENGREDRMAVHVFVTSKDRTELVYLNPYHRPSSPLDCSIRGSVAITEYDRTGIIPRESATRSYRLDAQRIFPMENIEEYCTKNDLKGGFFENVDTILDILIDQPKS